jgi:hypothetical protein
MSFFACHDEPIRTWAPPESPFRIEYSTSLLQEVSSASAGVDAFGVLYGVREGDTLRVVATRGRAGLEPIGIFASRVRGEIFLTEEDLQRFVKSEALVAMVVAGENGGFFVCDAGGAIETVQSYEEFPIVDQAPVAAVKKRPGVWAACLALIPLLFVFYRPHHPEPALTLNESAGQLKISWNVPLSGTVTIVDNDERIYAPIQPGQSQITYARRSGDVTVKIGSLEARFVGPSLPPTEIERARAGVKTLRAKVAALRAAEHARLTRIAELERRLQ